jgi:hypothetical protein
MQYQITLLAGVKKRQEFSGRTLAIMSLGAASSIDMAVLVNGFGVEELRGMKQGFQIRGPEFGGAEFLSAVDTTIEVVVTVADLSINTQEGSTVNANILGVVPVSNDRGAPGTPLYVSGITYADAPAVAMTNAAPVACSAVAAVLVAANAARRAVRFTNIGVDPVAIGATGITWASRCIVLNTGDTWIEDRAANLAWSAICDTGKTASVTAQGVTA